MGSSRALRWLLLVVLLGAVAAVLRARRAARLEWEQTWPAAVPPSTSPPDALAARRRPTRGPSAAETAAGQPTDIDEPVPVRAAATPTSRPASTTRSRPAVESAPAPAPPADPEVQRSPVAPTVKPSPRPRPAAAPPVESAPAADTTAPASQLRPRRPHLTLPETAAFAGPDGSPPGPEYTIKAKSGSTLFHGPDSPYFSRTRAEFWFRTAADARAAGLTEWTPRRRGRG